MLFDKIISNLDSQECLEFFQFIFGNPRFSDLVFNPTFPMDNFVMVLFILLKSSNNHISWNWIIFIIRKIYKISYLFEKQGISFLNIPKFLLPIEFIQPSLESKLYRNSLKYCGSIDELFDESIKFIFFKLFPQI